MTPFTTFLLFLLATLVSATSRPDISSKSCGKNEFWFVCLHITVIIDSESFCRYSDKNCCLPHGGPPTVPAPPKGQDCPPTGYYWGKKQGCCVPTHPPPSQSPPPQCRKGWKWFPYLHMCLPGTPPSPTSSSPPKPSKTPAHYDHKDEYKGGKGDRDDHKNGGHYKRSHKSRTPSLCPTGLDACPISGLLSDYECLDTNTELQSCGGCASTGEGQDCTAIKGAWNVGCESGKCAGPSSSRCYCIR